MGACLCKDEQRSSADPSFHPTMGTSFRRNLTSKRGIKKKPEPEFTDLPETPTHKGPDFGLTGSYQVIELLGEGGSGTTWQCRDLSTCELVAIKFIKRPIPRVVIPMVVNEVQIQARLAEGHCNLVNARSVVLTPTHLGLVLEYVPGGTLTNYVSSRWSSSPQRGGLFLEENEARYFFKQFISAVEYLHQHKVAHRDLKLDNIVMDGQSPPRIKLCDFGFANGWQGASSNMHTQIGTPVYMSPQMLSSQSTGAYDATKADVWACGVLLFVMLLGCFPFDHPDHPDPNTREAQADVWSEQIAGSWRSSPRCTRGVLRLSELCKDLLDKIFEIDEKKRITIEGIKEHPWFSLPCSPEMDAALAELEKKQTWREHMRSAFAQEAGLKDDEIQKLVQAAGRPHQMAGPPLATVRLSRLCKHGSTASTVAWQGSTSSFDNDRASSGGLPSPGSFRTTPTKDWSPAKSHRHQRTTSGLQADVILDVTVELPKSEGGPTS